MTTPLFSPYRQGENRVTSTFLAVLQRLSLPNMGRILGALLEDTAFNLVTFHNQPKGTKSTPDARIRTGPGILIETKTKRNDVRRKQITDHLQSLDNGERLLLLTPDDSKPTWLNDNRVVWSNFETLADAVEGDQGILNDQDEPPSEKEAFLLRELMRMLRQDRLVGFSDPSVLVVAAGIWAWGIYEKWGVYTCPTDRSFRPFSHMAFYANGEIKPLVPKVKSDVKSIVMSKEEQIEFLRSDYQKELAKQLHDTLKNSEEGISNWEFSTPHQIVFLTGPDDDETVRLPNPVKNNKKNKNGKPTPFTYGQPRYVSLETLTNARTTTDLERSNT